LLRLANWAIITPRIPPLRRILRYNLIWTAALNRWKRRRRAKYMLIANFQYQFYSKVRYFDPEFRLEAENRRCFSPGRPCLFAPRQAGIKACRPWGKTPLGKKIGPP
jgi:hypothetical protein